MTFFLRPLAQSVPVDSYRITSMGYDYLALHALVARGSVSGVGHRMGVGKESDIHIATDDEGRQLVIKMHRLGRTCFRQVRNKRDYLRPGQHTTWLHLSRLSALKEFAFMKALHMHGFPIPEPIDVNRHVIVMSLCKGAFPLNQVQEMARPDLVYQKLVELYIELASYGLVHCDFNEFNLLIDSDENITLIDFPQMVSTDHPQAAEFFARDVECLRTFFSKRFGFEPKYVPTLEADAPRKHNLDAELAASGWTRQHEEELERCDEAAATEVAFEPSKLPLLPPSALDDGQRWAARDEAGVEPEDADEAALGAAVAGGALPRAVRPPSRDRAVRLELRALSATSVRLRVLPRQPAADRAPSGDSGGATTLLEALTLRARAAELSAEEEAEGEGEGSASEDDDGGASTVMSIATAHRQAAIARRVRQEVKGSLVRQNLRAAKQGNRARKTSKKKADSNLQAKAVATASSGW